MMFLSFAMGMILGAVLAIVGFMIWATGAMGGVE